MAAPLPKAETTSADRLSVSQRRDREAEMIADHADCSLIEQSDSSSRKLRNRIILGNVVAWIVIIIVLRLVF